MFPDLGLRFRVWGLGFRVSLVSLVWQGFLIGVVKAEGFMQYSRGSFPHGFSEPNRNIVRFGFLRFRFCGSKAFLFMRVLYWVYAVLYG